MSWLYSQALVAEYSEGICSDGEPSAPSSGNPTQPVFSSADKTTVFSRRSLSGMTFRRLTESSGEAVLMSFLEDFPVRTYLAPEKAQESTERDLPCGDIWQESSVKFDLERCLWKTALCLWEEDLPESSVTLPKWGMMRSGACWEQSTPVRLTRGIGSGSWATPTTMDSLPPKSEKALLREATEVRPGRSKPGNLRDQVSNMKNWPTPQASDNRDRGNMSDPSIKRRIKIGKQIGLSTAVKPDAHGGSLNPTWVEWLMGWPLGWTDLKPLETDKFQQWQNSHGIPSTTSKTQP